MTNANPLIPGDIYRSGAVAHQDLATFAWLEFISAVSPNANGLRGVPGGSFAASGSGASNGPLVWETYQHRTELLPCNAVSSPTGPTTSPIAPQPWGAPPKYVTTASSTQLCSTITLPGGGPLPFNNLDEANQIGQNTLFYPTTPGKPQPNTDAQVLFEAKVNQYESNYVNQNYASFIPKFGPFHLSPGITLPNTTVEVKAAWRPVSSIPSNQRYRYHIANVLTYAGTDAAPVPKVVPYALIALHIIHKTPNYPSFIFATFEQVDDFTNQTTGQPTGVYYVPAYGAVAYTTPPTTTFPPSGQTVQNPNIGFNTAAPKAMPYGVQGGVALPLGNTLGFPGAKPVSGGRVAIPVTSPVPTVPEVATVNGQALTAMKGIPGFNQNFKWQYYKLTGVQAVPTNDETTRDFYLANIVVESSQPGIQLFRGFPPIAPNPKTKVPTLTNIRNQVNVIDYHTGASTLAPTLTSSGGCQGCHGIAQTQNGFDFSFLFFGVNGGGFTPETAGLPTPQVAAVRLANKKYFQK
ncbi:MAG: hypothetical protein WC729_07330 [Sphingomonas sp.]|jgi:hypothetical protein|uniref:hypothetical protein n=1 Tax=Sphingomonas sp. TaxID=28214 RepID=UPI00356285F3